MRRVAALLLLSLAVPAAAHQGDAPSPTLKLERVAPGIAVLFGNGGNIGISYGEDGNVLIDDQFAPLTPRILDQLHTLHEGPVRFLINTHWHGDHTGGNVNLGSTGTVIVAQDNVRRRLAVDNVSRLFKTTTKATPKAGLPVITFDAGVTMHLNGDDLQVVHVPHAHTDGDAMIYWPAANVLHTGDIFFNKVTFPFIDLESGGSIDGMIAGAERGLMLVKPGGKIIPGHGPVATREELQAYHDMLVDIRGKVAAAIRAGKTRAQVIAMGPAKPYVGRVSEGFITADDFAGTVYDSLTAKRR